jgi:hypothetical protein
MGGRCGRAFGALLCVCLALTAAVVAVGATDVARQATQWLPTEWIVSGVRHDGNPFDVVARVTFEHAVSGDRRVTEMFAIGGDEWRFRFTGTRPGRWTYRSASETVDLDGMTGAVDVAPNPDGVGFVTHVGSKWARQVGLEGRLDAFVPQYVMYDTPDVYHGEPAKIDRDIETFIVGHGFTGFHTVVFARWFDINNERTGEMPDDVNPDPRTFDALELLITKTQAAGGVTHLWAWGDESRRQTPIRWGINGEVDRRLQRYIAARLGPLPGWTMGYGYDLWEWVDGNQLAAWHAYMQDHMGWPHMLGARATSNTLDQIAEGLSYSGYEQHRPDYDTYVRTIAARPGAPAFSEDRFRIRPNSRYPDKDYDEARTRRGLWHSAMAGGVANIWGSLDAEGRSLPYPHAAWFRCYAAFFADRFASDMHACPEVVDGGVAMRSADGGRAIFYVEDADSLTIDLSDMSRPCAAVVVDALGPYAETDVGLLTPGKHTIRFRGRSDWAVAVSVE